MWVAKNSITGTIYGTKKFSSAMKCQRFIDKKLSLLEYEMQRCFALERETIEDLNDKSFFETIQDVLKSFEEETGIQDDIKAVVEFSISGKSQQELDAELHRLACCRWQRNNIIRCYDTKQERFADGFDF